MKFTPLERIALDATVHVSSAGVSPIIATWTVVWLSWNILASRPYLFDPGPAFVLWLFISNLIQILLVLLIMVGQVLLNRYAETRSEADFEIN